jgi:hypothetical protein
MIHDVLASNSTCMAMFQDQIADFHVKFCHVGEEGVNHLACCGVAGLLLYLLKGIIASSRCHYFSLLSNIYYEALYTSLALLKNIPKPPFATITPTLFGIITANNITTHHPKRKKRAKRADVARDVREID